MCRLCPNFVWCFFIYLFYFPNSAQLCLGRKLRQNSLYLKWLLLLWHPAGVSSDGTVTVLSAQPFELNCLCHSLYESLQSLLSCSALSPALTSSPSVAVSSGAAVLCRRGQQERDGRRGRNWSTEERTLWEGWREGTVHTQNIPSKEASGQIIYSNQIH